MLPTLITIPFSHYCEKARWALDRAGVSYREDGHLPILHAIATRRVGGRSVPVLVTETGTIADSTEIVAWADAQHPGAWLPRERVAREESLSLEDELDVQLGPATRRWGYFWVLPETPLLRVVTARGVPRWEARTFRIARPLASAMLRRGLNINPASVEQSRHEIEAVFARIDRRLADGRRFLVGDVLSVADLTFATLATPVVIPPEQHFGLAAELELLPEPARRQIDEWRARPCGEFALRMFAEHRNVLA